MKKLILSTYLFLISFLNFSQTSTQNIVLKQNKGSLEGTILTPSVSGAFPVVLIIAGSGPTDRDGNNPMADKSNSYKLLAEKLAENGIASLRYDKRGVAKSSGAGVREADLTFETYVDDAAQFIDTLRKDKRFSKIIIAGHSEGSLIGMLALQKAKADAYISMAGPARRIDEIINTQIATQPVPDSVKKETEKYFSKLRQGEKIPKIMQNMLIFSLFRPSVQPYIISWLKYTPTEEIRKVNIPTLIVQGKSDQQVGETEGLALSKAKPDAEYLPIEAMTHSLKDENQIRQQEIKSEEIPLSAKLTEGIIQFIQKL